MYKMRVRKRGFYGAKRCVKCETEKCNNAGPAFWKYSKTTFLANNFITASVLLFNCSELFLALLFVLF